MKIDPHAAAAVVRRCPGPGDRGGAADGPPHVDGSGDPNGSEEYRQAIEALYGLSYALKFIIKKTSGVDYRVMPPEGLWWVEDLSQLDMERRKNWKWTSMIMQPDPATESYVRKAIEELRRKKGPAALSAR